MRGKVKRVRVGLIALLTLCMVLFLESRIEALVPQIRNAAQFDIEKAFGGRARISIGAIDGGILHPITLSDITIKNAKDTTAIPPVSIKSIKTNYRLWDIFFRIKELSGPSGRIPKGLHVDMLFAMEDRNLYGFTRIETGQRDSKFRGFIELNKERFDFSGVLRQDGFNAVIMPQRGIIKITGKILPEECLEIDLKINHLKLKGFDVTCSAVVKNRVMRISNKPGETSLEGEIESGSIALNYKPFLNFKGVYKAADNALIAGLNLGESFKLEGSAGLKYPYNSDLTLTANNISLTWLTAALGNSAATSILSGTLNGKLELKGPILNPKSNSNIEIRKGAVGGLEFETLTANLKGDGPILRIEDSRITRESGYFVLAGEIDLQKMGKAAMFEGVKLESDESAILWDGWGSSKINGGQEVRMTKRINDDINLDFKKIVSEDKVDESMRDKDDVKLEYKLHSNDSLKMMVGNDKDFFGLEHKDKF